MARADQPGNRGSLPYRKGRFSRIKPGNQDRIQEAVRQRNVDILWRSNVGNVRSTAGTLAVAGGPTRERRAPPMSESQ